MLLTLIDGTVEAIDRFAKFALSEKNAHIVIIDHIPLTNRKGHYPISKKIPIIKNLSLQILGQIYQQKYKTNKTHKNNINDNNTKNTCIKALTMFLHHIHPKL